MCNYINVFHYFGIRIQVLSKRKAPQSYLQDLLTVIELISCSTSTDPLFLYKAREKRQDIFLL